jgi:hypothetical protein
LESSRVLTLHFFTKSGSGSESKRTKNACTFSNVDSRLPSAAPCATCGERGGRRGNQAAHAQAVSYERLAAQRTAGA